MIRELRLLVVYVVRDDDDEFLLDLHLDRVARHTTVPYRILAATPHVTARAAAVLAARPDVEVVPIPPFGERGSREHAHHLDALLARAVADTDADHLGTLDLDSFPVRDAWHDLLLAPSPPPGIAGILRRENGDTVLPHPSCLLLPRRFVEAHPVSFSPDSDGTREFREFLRRTGQRADTGIRLARLLSDTGTPWHRVTRSNAVDLHPVIAGLYGDAVFHLGAGTRRRTVFRRDLAASRVHRWTAPIERLPVPGALRAGKRRVLAATRGRAERRIIAGNRAAAATAIAALRRDPDALFAHLRGEGPLPAA
ncbi:MAG: hypothetical protein ACXVJ7_03120 [Acidimicrobiia bacterium]